MRHIRPDGPGGPLALIRFAEDARPHAAPPGITRPEWAQLKDDLLELNRAGALGGIRAIVAERLLQVRGGWKADASILATARMLIAERELDTAAALLAAEIDRQSQP